MVFAYVALLNDPAAIGQVFNICSGKARTLREIIAMIKELSQHDFDVTVNPAFVRANEVKTLWGSPSKIENLTGQRPTHHLQDTLAWMLKG